MHDYGIFRALGLYVAQNVLDEPLQSRLLTAAREGQRGVARVSLKGEDDGYFDGQQRRTKVVEVDPTSMDLTNHLLNEFRPSIQGHFVERGFSGTLVDHEPPQFLAYFPGDFFVMHADRDREGNQKRQISVIIFLNDQRDQADQRSYSGGELRIHGEIAGKMFNFPLKGEAGLLVAFRSETIHEVSPVKEGERYTIVSWYI